MKKSTSWHLFHSHSLSSPPSPGTALLGETKTADGPARTARGLDGSPGKIAGNEAEAGEPEGGADWRRLRGGRLLAGCVAELLPSCCLKACDTGS